MRVLLGFCLKRWNDLYLMWLERSLWLIDDVLWFHSAPCWSQWKCCTTVAHHTSLFYLHKHTLALRHRLENCFNWQEQGKPCFNHLVSGVLKRSLCPQGPPGFPGPQGPPGLSVSFIHTPNFLTYALSIRHSQRNHDIVNEIYLNIII